MKYKYNRKRIALELDKHIDYANPNNTNVFDLCKVIVMLLEKKYKTSVSLSTSVSTKPSVARRDLPPSKCPECSTKLEQMDLPNGPDDYDPVLVCPKCNYRYE